jgi:2'-5' RNA ligase
MSDAIRCFLAVKVPSNRALERAIDELSRMGSVIKAVAPSNLHITLKFMGDVQPGQLDAIGRTMRDAAASEGPFRFAVRGFGAFPSSARPSVLWAGVSDAEPLRRLATALETSLAPLGFAPEGRPYAAHLTLARVKFRPPAELPELFERYASMEFQTVDVDRIILYRSDSGRGGPVYSPIAEAKLESD